MKTIYFILAVGAGILGVLVYDKGNQSGGIWMMTCGGALLARIFD